MGQLLDSIMEQLFYYHSATDMPLVLLGPDGEVLQSFPNSGYYCELAREACGERAFCDRLHAEGCHQAAQLEDAYIFSCPAGLVHFAVPILDGKELLCTVLAGPVAVEYPDIAVVDNLIQQCGCSLNYRKRLYGALSSVSIVEPVRLQYMSQLLKCLMGNLCRVAGLRDRLEDAGVEETGGQGGETGADPVRTPILENALRYIDMHYAENIRLDEVARHIGLNPSYFSTIFKREMHIGFSQYIMKKKIEEACRLLKTTNYPLVDISNELGFDNQSYFSRSFKKFMGVSPNQYRHGQSTGRLVSG